MCCVLLVTKIVGSKECGKQRMWEVKNVGGK